MVKRRDFVTGAGAVVANCVSSRFAFSQATHAVENRRPVPPPGGGLTGNSNYFFYSGGNPIAGLSVILDVTKDIVAPFGLSIQLNAYSPANASCVWQQYYFGFYTDRGANRGIWWTIDNWPSAEYREHLHETIGVAPGDLINTEGLLIAMPGSGVTLPAGYKFKTVLA